MQRLLIDTGLFVNYLLSVSLILFLLVPLQLTLLRFFSKKTEASKRSDQQFFSCIVTSYGPPDMCRYLIDSLVKGVYSNFEILVVLDGTQESFTYEHSKVKLIRPVEALNSKLKSIKLAIEQSDPLSTGAVILDPDNLAHPSLLLELNNFFLNPYAVVQGKRKAKNTDTALSRADALAEAYYNKTDRELPFAVGSSATLAGSGICIQKDLLSEFIQKILSDNPFIILGEDKLLQNYLVQQGERISYAEKAIVFDEKIDYSIPLRRQRARWINAYFENVKGASRTFFTGLFSTNWNMVVFGLITLRPPLFINLTLIFLLLLVNMYISMALFLALGVSLLLFSLYFILLINQMRLTRFLPYLPEFIADQFAALFASWNYKRHFGKTNARAFLTIEEVLKNDTLP